MKLLVSLPPLAWLLVNVQSLMARGGRGRDNSFSPALMAPPLVLRPSARLPLNVELVMVAAELLLMAPPLPSPVPAPEERGRPPGCSRTCCQSP